MIKNNKDNLSENAYIGKRIRARRNEVGISIRELGRRTDLTASFLSQIELGQANASVNSLRRIAVELGVNMMYFFKEAPIPNPVIRADKRPTITFVDPDVTYELLTPERTHKLEVLLGRTNPCVKDINIARKLEISTEELIIVLSGVLNIGLEGGDYELNPGDSIYFKGEDLISISCSSEEETTWISCMTPPGF